MAHLATLATTDPAPASSEGKLWATGFAEFWGTSWSTLPASSTAWEVAVVAAPLAAARLGADLNMCPRQTRAPREAATPRPARPAAAPPPRTRPLLTIPTRSQL